MAREAQPTIESRRPPRRPLERVRRPEILAATVELIRERGLWSVRVADVAERAGTSPGTVIYYFGTKDQLLEQAVADADAEFYAELWPELDALQSGIDRLVRILVRSSGSDWEVWIDLSVYARLHPEMLASERAFHRRWRTTLAEAIRHGQARGEFRAQVDPERVAIRLASLTDGLAVRMALQDGVSSRDYVALSLEAVAAELGCELERLRAAADEIETT